MRRSIDNAYTTPQLVLLSLWQNTCFKHNHPFGRRDMFLFKILDEIILSITSAKENSVGEVWKTQNLFAWSNIFLLLYLVNFGDDFFTEKLSTKKPIYKKNVLRWGKQMVSTESDSKVPANAINCKPQTGRVPPVALERFC